MFAVRLKDLRYRNNMTQAQLAQALAMANGTIAMWETGKREPDIKTILRIAKYFDVSSDYLLGNDRDDEYSSEFRERLSCELEVLKTSLTGDESAVTDYYELEEIVEHPRSLLLSDACKVAEKVGQTVGYLLGESDVDTATLTDAKKSPGTDESEPRDDIEREFISLLHALRPAQKALALSLLKTAVAESQGKPGAGQASVYEKGTKIGHQDVPQ